MNATTCLRWTLSLTSAAALLLAVSLTTPSATAAEPTKNPAFRDKEHDRDMHKKDEHHKKHDEHHKRHDEHRRHDEHKKHHDHKRADGRERTESNREFAEDRASIARVDMDQIRRGLR